jgi:transaldolase
MTNQNLKSLSDAGVSIWLDDLSRSRIDSGNLADLIASSSVSGVTTNPSIFQAAISDGDTYAPLIAKAAAHGDGVDEVIFALTTNDVRDACDIFAPVAAATKDDGRVSIEVEPTLANDTDATITSAKALWASVDRPNVLIKIPATLEGLPAITEVIGAGISVNVTLIFSTERYEAVMDAYLAGLEKAKAAGIDLSTIRSVASFFVSRVDTEIDARLEKIGTEEALALRGKAALANARLAYAAYEEVHSGSRWTALAEAGANAQRPLWASTGVKNPDYSDTLYVADLVAANTVNTMPEKTMQAFADHGVVTGDEVSGRGEESQAVFDALSAVGIDLPDVFDVLETEGVDKFKISWTDLQATVAEALKKA